MNTDPNSYIYKNDDDGNEILSSRAYQIIGTTEFYNPFTHEVIDVSDFEMSLPLLH